MPDDDTLTAEEQQHFDQLRQMQAELDQRRADELIEIAASMGVTLTRLDPEFAPGVSLLYEGPNGCEIEIVRMIFNWRLCEADGRYFYHRSWCYGGTGDDTFRVAMLALRIWRADRGSQPPGYLKAVVGEPIHACAGVTTDSLLAMLPADERPVLDRFTIARMDATLRRSEAMTVDPLEKHRRRVQAVRSEAS